MLLFSKREKVLLTFIAILLIALPTTYAIVQSALPTVIIGPGTGVSEADFIFFVDGVTYYAVNGLTGEIEYYGTDLGIVVDSVIADSGRYLQFKRGTFQLTANHGLDLDETGIHLECAGYSTVFTCSNGFANHIIHITGVGCTLDNFRINGDGQNAAYYGLYIEATRSLIENFRIENCGSDGVHIGHSTWTGIMGGKLHHGTITSNDGNGLYIDYDATDWEFIDLLISVHTTTNKAGIVIDGGSGLISSCHLWGNYQNIIIAPVHNVYRVRIVNNKIADNIKCGIYVGSGHNFRDSVIVGNEFWANGYSAPYDHSDSIYFLGAGLILCVTITGNSFYGYKEDVSIQCTRYAIVDVNDKMDNCVIVGNTFDRFFEADPIEMVSTTHNSVGYNSYYMNG